MIKTTLADAPAEIELIITAIEPGIEAKKRLLALGLHVGDRVRKHNGSHWGPVLVQNITQQSGKVAIGRGLARRISVSHESG